MSRIGKLHIPLPTGVQFQLDDNHIVTVKGPLGELTQYVDPCISFEVENNEIIVKRESDQKRHKAMHGLYRMLVANMVHGVSEGFTSVQEVVGVGFKASAEGQILDLALGYSHNIIFELPKEVSVVTTSDKGKNPTITLKSIDKQLLGQVAAKIRSLRKPEPYKGKGIRFKGEELRKKAGKTASK
ncbi:MAG: 50S ribosomal protein L6 [Bacteroidales bacterium]|nr:50S ribosomal protein L6 [Bacteroidales bacterium]MDY0216211.1 50S ribosomal protein L6 [Bacteroidales bacterium]